MKPLHIIFNPEYPQIMRVDLQGPKITELILTLHNVILGVKPVLFVKIEEHGQSPNELIKKYQIRIAKSKMPPVEVIETIQNRLNTVVVELNDN